MSRTEKTYIGCIKKNTQKQTVSGYFLKKKSEIVTAGRNNGYMCNQENLIHLSASNMCCKPALV